MQRVVLLLCCVVAQICAVNVVGIPSSVCGTQTFATTYQTTNPVTFVVSSSSSQVTVTPAAVTYSAGTPVNNITVACRAVGPVELIFSQGGSARTTSVYTFCSGVFAVVNPIDQIIRGEQFTLDIELFPTPVKEVDLLVTVEDAKIIPGSERVFFGVEQSIANAIFYVPSAGQVGPSEIVIRSRSLRDYSGPNCEDVRLSIIVQGRITSNITAGLEIGTGEVILVEVTIDPPAVDTVLVNVDASQVGSVDNSTLVFLPGTNRVVFNLSITQDPGNQGCVVFTSDFYVPATQCFSVIGNILSTLPSQINTYTIETYFVQIIPPAPAGGLVLNITTSANAQATAQVFFSAGESIESFQLVGIDGKLGAGFIEFRADGYETLRTTFNVYEVLCANNATISQDGEECLNCPLLNGETCANHGTCVYSQYDGTLARCVCETNYFGPRCEFSTLQNNSVLYQLEQYSFGAAGLTFTTEVIPLTISTSVRIPGGLLSDGVGGLGELFLQPYTAQSGFQGAVNPYQTLPVIAGETVRVLNSGFSFEITAYDNTLTDDLTPPVLVRFAFHPLEVSQSEFVQLELCYYEAGVGWVSARSVCATEYQFVTRDLLRLTYSTNLCRSGQYQFFVISPDPYHTVVAQVFPDVPLNIDDDDGGAAYFTTTGLTGGVQPPLPPQPNVPEIDPLGKPSPVKVDAQPEDLPFNANFAQSFSSGSVLSSGLIFVVSALLMAFL